MNPLSVIIHGRQQYYLAAAGNMRALHTTIALAQLHRRRREPRQWLNATAVPRMAENAGGRYADSSVWAIKGVDGGGGGEENMKKLPQCAFTGHAKLQGPKPRPLQAASIICRRAD